MPKRVGFLYEKMLDRGFIQECILKAARHKKHRRPVRRVLEHIDAYVEKTYAMMERGEYVPAPPRRRTIYDDSSQKYREIQTVPFWPDAIVQWMLVEAMKPVLMRGMYHWSCASIPGRGGARVRKRLKGVLQKDPKGTKYAAEIDIRKYYPNIDIHLMMKALRRKIKDKRFLDVVEAVLKTSESGLAIGFYMNQWLANFYLEPLDGFLVSLQGVKYMTRYMDNIVLLGPNKKNLHQARKEAGEYAKRKLELEFKGDWQVFPIRARQVSSVGFRFGRGYVTLRRRNFIRLARQCRRIAKRQAAGKQISFHQAASVLSRIGQLRHCDGFKARVKYVDCLKIKAIKEVVSNESKRRLKSRSGIYGRSAA